MGTVMRTFPFTALIRRELLTSLRETWLFASLAVLMLVLGLVVASSWPGNPLLAGAGASASKDIFITFCLVMMSGAVLLMPGMGAGSIVTERDGQTYDQLHLTLIRPGGMVIGKLVNAVGVFLLFYCATLPVLAAISFLVGMDLRQISLAAAVILITGITCSCLGLFASAVLQRSLWAIVAAYVLMLLYMELPVFVLLVSLELVDQTFASANDVQTVLDYWLQWFSPLGVLLGAGRGAIRGVDLAPLAISSGAVSAACLGVASRRLSRPSEPQESLVLSKATGGARVRSSGLAYFADGANPITTREILCTAPWFRHWRTRIIGGLAVLFFICNVVILLQATPGRPWDRDLVIAALMLQILCPLVVTPACVANTLTKERTLGNLDLLRTTLMSPQEIVRGKAMGALGLLRPLLVAQLLGSLPVALYALGAGIVTIACAGCVTLLVSVYLALALGLVASALARNAGHAVVLAYGFTAVVFVLEPVLLAISYNGPRAFSEGGGLFLTCQSPPFVFGMMSDWLLRKEPVPYFVSPWLYWSVCTAVQVLLALGCLRLATRMSARRVD